MIYEEAVSYISDIPKFTKKTAVSHTIRLLEQLGHPERAFPVIHVAGTNGKGSVCAYLDSAFRAAGCRTGLFTSPHLVRVNERFQISGQEVADEDFTAALEEVLSAVRTIQAADASYEHPTYFETLFAMGMVIFRKAGVRAAILETGMGGRLDATNAIEEPILTVITSISLDHMQYLGSTISEIAREKAGIIKPGIPVVYDASDMVAEQVILSRAQELGSPAVRVSREQISEQTFGEDGFTFTVQGVRLHIPQAAAYQVMNASIAWYTLAAWNRLADEKNLPQVSDAEIHAGFEQMQWPCRMETVMPRVIIDGAHNADGIAQFIRTAARFHEKYEITLLYGSVSDKDYRTMIRELAEGIRPERVVTTRVAGSREVSEEIFAGLFRENGICHVFSDPSPEGAFDLALAKRGEGMLFCVGSLYLAGKLRSHVQQLKAAVGAGAGENADIHGGAGENADAHGVLGENAGADGDAEEKSDARRGRPE